MPFVDLHAELFRHNIYVSCKYASSFNVDDTQAWEISFKHIPNEMTDSL